MQSSFPPAKALEKEKPQKEIRVCHPRIEALKRESEQMDNRDCLNHTKQYINGMMIDRFRRGLSNDTMMHDVVFSKRFGLEKPSGLKFTFLRC
jgi:hypothetical protein